MDNKAIGNNIKTARKAAHLTQAQLASLIGKSKSSVQKYELGLVEIPGSVIERISIATNCKRRYIDGAFDWDDTIDEDEQPGKERLLDSFNRLNHSGQQVAIERVEELTEIPKYRK